MNSNNRVIGLDLVRGIAAAMVMMQHTFEAAGLSRGAWDPFVGYVNFGQAGVVAFFLVSGFVIPMSLERSGSQRAFWIGRAFRLYPMYIVAFILSIFLADGRYDPATVLSHLFFVQEFIPNVQDQVPNSWTLSIEVAWYLSTSILFALGLLGRSGLLTGLALAALVATGIAAWFFPAIPAGRFGLLATCLVGMIIYRQVSKQSNEWLNIGVLIITLFCLIALNFRLVDGVPQDRFHPQTILAAWALGYCLFFAGLRFGHILPGRAIVAWLGSISYSVYLLHSFFILIGDKFSFEPLFLILFVFTATVGASTMTQKFIELPLILLGKKTTGSVKF